MVKTCSKSGLGLIRGEFKVGIGFSEIHSGLGCGCGRWCGFHDGVGLGSEARIGFVVKAPVDGIGVGWG